jgi:hypothetical protein
MQIAAKNMEPITFGLFVGPSGKTSPESVDVGLGFMACGSTLIRRCRFDPIFCCHVVSRHQAGSAILAKIKYFHRFLVMPTNVITASFFRYALHQDGIVFT